MKKNCPICGRFSSMRLHGACLKCLKSQKKLPPAIAAMKEEGIHARSIRGIKRAANTLVLDGTWYAVKWDPAENLRKVLETATLRPYLSKEVIEEIQEILESLD